MHLIEARCDKNLKREKTITIVAHRLSSVSNCDKIFKLKSGKLIQEGIPDEVLQNNLYMNNCKEKINNGRL
jgi:ABC-type multidrug transport system fused ATPase/permease subunit